MYYFYTPARSQTYPTVFSSFLPPHNQLFFRNVKSPISNNSYKKSTAAASHYIVFISHRTNVFHYFRLSLLIQYFSINSENSKNRISKILFLFQIFYFFLPFIFVYYFFFHNNIIIFSIAYIFRSLVNENLLIFIISSFFFC